MKNLIEALTIFSKYQDLACPTSCAYDILYIMGITEEEVSPEDRTRLEELEFLWGTDGVWLSYRYGSA